jgi:hypothetical protein
VAMEEENYSYCMCKNFMIMELVEKEKCALTL